MANRAQLYKYKGNRCSACGMEVAEMVNRYGTFKRIFAFHHIDPDTKDKNYNQLMKKSLSSEQIEEIDKCALLCNHCHDIIHAQEITGSISITVEFDNRKVSQNLKGWFIHDKIENKLTFVTNQRLLLQVCRVQFNNQAEKHLCVIEIEKEENLLTWLKNIKKHKKILIRSAVTNEILMRIEHIKKKTIKVRQKVGFPITAIDLKVDEGDASYLWFRNGMGLTKEGEVFDSGTLNYTSNLVI
jgi:hypothetical protein